MTHTVKEIGTALGMDVLGAVSLKVTGVAEPAVAKPEHLVIAMTPEFIADLPRGAARVAVLPQDTDWQDLGLEAAIIAPRPRYAMSGVTAMMDPGQGWADGIHPSAVIDESARIGAGVSIGPLSVIGPRAHIGGGTRIGPQCHVGTDSVIGAHSLLREGVRIGARATIGERLFAQPGAVVGGDGFSFVTPETSSVEQARRTLGDSGDTASQSWARIHSLGSVTIGDDVELGANCTIDSGTVRDTCIGTGTKIDNLVMIGHNVEVGRDCLLCGMVGIAGSTRIGNNVVLAGQTGVSDNIFIGDNVITGGGTIVLSNIPAGRVMLGYPAMKMDGHIDLYKRLRRLGRVFDDVAALKKAVFKSSQSE